MQQRVFLGRNFEFINSLEDDLRTAKSIKIIVSFIRESGVRAISSAINQAAKNGAEIKILTGTYLNITEPSALYMLKELLHDGTKLHIYDKYEESFHPKGYLIKKEEVNKIYIGSSNISRSGLQSGLEWNYMLEDTIDGKAVNDFEAGFDQIFDHESNEATDDFLRDYAQHWHTQIKEKSKVIRPYRFSEDREEVSVGNVSLESEQLPYEVIEPRGIQIEALYELELARKEGISKGIVIAATGVGKTYISAFDAKRINAGTLLFVAHREEILCQALESFKLVHPDKVCVLFNGNHKDTEADYIFASVQTLGKSKYLSEKYFSDKQFEYIVIDEFHHAAADGYKKIIDYFKPKFLLGLTATPYRMDNKDIMSLCDDNIIYEIDLPAAINRGALCPYKYLAVYDITDYSKIGISNGKYNTDELEKAYQLDRRKYLIYDKFKEYGGNYTVGFCASIKHADDMAFYFRNKGIEAVAIHSQMEPGQVRKDLITQFAEGKTKVIFVVDIFNEGIDIPEIDTVMFLRPTESYVVFLQQLGRGLRKNSLKEYLTVIDFIGNYKKAHYKPLLLSGINPLQGKTKSFKYHELTYPEDCSVNFDLRVIDLFNEMKKHDPKKGRMREEYFRIKDEIGRRPTRYDIQVGSDIDAKEYFLKGYLNFLEGENELADVETPWMDAPIESFLLRMEKTSMSRSYKLPVLKALIENDGKIGYDLLGSAFQAYYTESKQRQRDLELDTQNRNWSKWKQNDFLKLALKNPVLFLAKTESRFILHDEINRVVYFSEEIRSSWTELLKAHLLDIIKVKELKYYSRKYLIPKGE